MSLALVPLYVYLLGVESFGIIGIYTLIQSWLALFDAGIRPMLSREMARWKSGILSGLAARNLLRSAEILILAIGIVSMVTMLGLSGIIAKRWLTTETLRSEEHTSELQSLMRISYAVFCLKKTNINKT